MYAIRNWLLTVLAGKSPIAINCTIEGRIVLPLDAANGYFRNVQANGLYVEAPPPQGEEKP